MRVLINRVETYRVDSEEDVKNFIEEVKADPDGDGYVLKTYSSDHKEKKQKGEVIDEGYMVKLTKVYNEFWA